MESKSLLKQISPKSAAFYADFSELDNINNFAERAIDALDGIDILINNAGMLARETFFELSPEKCSRFSTLILLRLYILVSFVLNIW
jgi:glucose 1-dehydrogenase